MKMHKWYFVAALTFCAATAVGSDTPAKSAAPKPSDHPTAAADPHQKSDSAKSDSAPGEAPTPDESLRQLIEGNERYLSALVTHPHGDAERRCDTFTNGQHPIASILSCADSRAPVELLFDQGIGDLFVVRVAGNVSDTDEIGTVEYGAGHLHTPLIVVLGHTKCGAVTAVVNEAKVSENIAKLVDNIVPAVATAKKNLPGAKGETLIQAAIDANVLQSISDLLSHSEEIRDLVAAGKVKVVGAVYDIHMGSVRWLGEHPRQAELIKGTLATGGREAHGELLHSANAKSDHAAAHAASAEHAAIPAKAAKAAAESGHGSPAHAAEKKAEEGHDAHADLTSDASKPLMPHETGTLKGMLIPGAFIGSATLASGVIFHFMKPRKSADAAAGKSEHPSTPETAAPEPAKA